MSIPLLAILAGICFVLSVSAGIWLFLHLTSLAAQFEGYADLVPADARPRQSRKKMLAAITILIAGATACLLIALALAMQITP